MSSLNVEDFTMRTALLVLAAAVLIVACGTVSTPVPTGQGDAGNTSDGGAANDAGSGSTGGAGDAGATGSDAGTSGGGSADAGSGSGSGSGGSGSGGGSDGGSGSGTPTTHTLSVDINGPDGAIGTVSSNPVGISCAPSCSADFADGSDVMLTATPGPDSLFGAWEGGVCSGSNPTCTVHLTRDAQVSAVFQHAAKDECAGLGPGPVGDPTGSAEIQPAQFESCLTGPPNGDGIVAVGTIRGPAAVEDTSWTFFDAQGLRRGGFKDFNGTVAEKASGFIMGRAEESNPSSGRREVLAVDNSGSIVASTSSTTESYGWILAVHPFGGVVVEAQHPADPSAPAAIVWFDDQLHERWRAQIPDAQRLDNQVLEIGVDRQGNVLVLLDGHFRYGGDALGAVWIDPSGKPGDEFKAGDLHWRSTLFPRVGNGFFVQDQLRNWSAQFEPFAGPTQPPAWLAARPETTLHMARGGRAYAVIARPTGANNVPSCSTAVEVVAPSGRSCGTAVFTTSSGPTGDGNSICQSSITVGYDGTALQTKFAQPGTCNWQWWSGFFK